ncbi:hemin uptake protein HemP [Pseudoxanthomonas putridarboris]|uniref:Hemin uptake protein HemP n=1 Tax=Pseudoxanthomonas putridarboris TaxID=752605 RepID=A0ABU9IY25_9GAMM
MITNVTPLPTVDSTALRERISPRLATPAADESLDSEVLLKGRREILIRHGDRVYRLRHTSNDKLILTK